MVSALYNALQICDYVINVQACFYMKGVSVSLQYFTRYTHTLRALFRKGVLRA